MSWQTEGLGPLYLPVLNAAETEFAIPANLLARMAYQESHFRSDIINGSVKSDAGAVGIMQLLPQFFPGAGIDPRKDIVTAARYLADLHTRFDDDWQMAVAAYNWGPGSLHHWLTEGGRMPFETANYVADVYADVPVSGSIMHA